MRDEYAVELERLLERFGFGLARKPELVQELLSVRFPQRIMENHLIEIAVVAGIPAKLMDTTINYSIDHEIESLATELEKEYSFKHELAVKAVQAWALALGLKCSEPWGNPQETLNKRVFLDYRKVYDMSKVAMEGATEDTKNLHKKAEEGDCKAQQELGYAFYYGTGVNKDYDEAFRWLSLSAKAGNVQAIWKTGCCYYFGHGVAQNQQYAFGYFVRAGEQGHSRSLCFSGECLLKGKGVETNPELAVLYFDRAEKLGDSWGAYYLGYCYQHGKGVEQCEKKSALYYKRSAELGNPSGQYRYAICCAEGVGVKQDSGRARKWFTAAADQGHKGAQHRLEVLHKICRE